ncbi:MAG: hypothetical protein SFZ23_12335 [Planctomycetota bacterium]|nr:hypothetical protein [Planctomycetota bacterium]
MNTTPMIFLPRDEFGQPPGPPAGGFDSAGLEPALEPALGHAHGSASGPAHGQASGRRRPHLLLHALTSGISIGLAQLHGGSPGPGSHSPGVGGASPTAQSQVEAGPVTMAGGRTGSRWTSASRSAGEQPPCSLGVPWILESRPLPDQGTLSLD